MAWYYEYRPSVSAAEKRRRAAREMQKRAKKGLSVEPVVVEGRAIARTFWGKAWCDHLERYCDFENRLPRGRTYVRSGAVVHLGIERRRIEALVQGTELYEVEVSIAGLARTRWKTVVGACAGKIDSLVELLQGRLSSGVMRIVTDPKQGLFPAPAQIEVKCSCPDWATMCKHVAAVLYGIGARLDSKPELLFLLRGVDHLELLDGKAAAPSAANDGVARNRIAEDQLGSVFGIEIDANASSRGAGPVRTRGVTSVPANGARRAPRAVEAKRTRRSRSEIGDTVDAIVELLRRHPDGLRAEQIRAVLAIPAKELPRPIAEGLLSRRLRKTGRKRATTYFTGR
jgi:uncharacterized Zn finger protein